MNKRVAVLFGGRAPEHEVSIITGIQILHALKGLPYEVVPIYLNKSGSWILGDDTFYKPDTFKNEAKAIEGKKVIFPLIDPKNPSFLTPHNLVSAYVALKKLKFDIFFPAFHGRYGEDGSIQGLFEMMDVTYVGCDVQASAIGMDKAISKRVAKSINVPVLDDVVVYKHEWIRSKNEAESKIVKQIREDVFVKPARLGSSIGLTHVHNKRELNNALEVAFCYDTKVMVEKALKNPMEVNISVMGNNPYEVSVCEQPISSGDTLTFQDKYLPDKTGPSKGMASTKRIIPAKIKSKTREIIEKYTKTFFAEMGGQGLARIDYLVSKDESKIYFNEINTFPGSVAFYLWKEKGVNFSELCDKLIKMAIARSEEKEKLVTIFQSNILEGFNKASEKKFSSFR